MVDLIFVGVLILLGVVLMLWVAASVIECAVGSHLDRKRDLSGFDILPPEAPH